MKTIQVTDKDLIILSLALNQFKLNYDGRDMAEVLVQDDEDLAFGIICNNYITEDEREFLLEHELENHSIYPQKMENLINDLLHKVELATKTIVVMIKE